MFASFLKIFLRNFTRHRLFSLINVVGLALGLCCCLVIALFVRHELSYDRHYTNAERLYLVRQAMPQQNGGGLGNGYSALPLAEVLPQEVPGISAAGRLVNVPFAESLRIQSDSAEGSENNVRFADSGFLRLFDFVWLHGNPATALDAPDSIVLTRTLAEKYFGTIDVLGNTLMLDDRHTARVTGVVDDLRALSVIDFVALLPLEYFVRERIDNGMEMQSWSMLFSQTFALLDATATPEQVASHFPALSEKHVPPGPAGVRPGFNLQALGDIYLQRSFQVGGGAFTNLDRVRAFVVIGLCILLIAIVNFMNLSTSRASTRALEVGLRRVLGSGQSQLVRHFLAEAVLLTGVAMLLALALAELLLPAVNGILNLQLGFGALPALQLVPALLGATLLVGLLAGSWPAYYLSRGEPVRILHGELTRGRNGLWLRNALVICQFTVSIVLIVATLVMYGQLRHLRALDLGFNPNQVATVTLPDKQLFNLDTGWTSLEQRLRSVDGVMDLTHAIDSPLLNMRMVTRTLPRDGEPPVDLHIAASAANYLQFYDTALLAGRYFDADAQADRVPLQPRDAPSSPRGSFIINERAARELGWTPEEALGKDFAVGVNGVMHGTVVGVVENTIASVQNDPAPLLYYVPAVTDYFFISGKVSLSVAADRIEGFNERLRAAWTQHFPSHTPQIQFLDSVIAAQYQQEQNQLRVFGYAAVLAVLIACFGLLGLAAFNAERRTKEIGVRRVVGGSIWSIVWLLTHDFSKLVLVSNVLAWPLAYWGLQRWLSTFAYRIELTPLLFVASGLIALCIAWVTVGGTAANAARRRPVLALRYE